MKKSLLLAMILCLFFAENLAFGQINQFPYSQSFEESFATGSQLLFLPNWWGNEVNTNSRIFRTTTAAKEGAAALAAEPTGSFTPQLRLLLNTQTLETAALSFWARSAQNGTGTRSTQLLLSFSADGGLTFSSPVTVGGAAAFPNADTEFQQYSFALPAALLKNPEVVIRWQMPRSEEGTGTAARLLLDGVEIKAAEPQLQLLKVEPLSASRLLLHFNRPLQKASAENTAHYSFQPTASITGARLKAEDPAKVLLELMPLSPGTYTLSAADVVSADGDLRLPPTTLSFTFQHLPQFRELVINEIFADPNPKGSLRPQPVVLPEAADAEFIELFNASDHHWQLQDLRLNGAQPTEFLLAPGAYVTLVPAGKKDLYATYGPVAEVAGWKNLSNSGSSLQLIHTPSGRLLDSLSYSQSWYATAGKQEGGWSLEQINPYLKCSQPGNWKASADPKGASPGSPNSQLDTTPDTLAPQLLMAVAQDPQQLLLFFDEYLAPGSLTIENIVLKPAASLTMLQHKGKQVVVQLAEPLQEGKIYHIQLQGFSDCSGNGGEGTAALIWPRPAMPGDLVINEIMYSPEPDGAEWVELYNPTPHYLNLQGWFMGLREDRLKASIKLSEDLLLLPPRSFMVVSAQAETVSAAFPDIPPQSLLQLKGMPNLRNSGDTLVLLTPSTQLAESAAYSDKLHHPLLHNSKGVSLERIDPGRAALQTANWTSAAAPSYGTPGRQNSQFHQTDLLSAALSIEPEVLEPSPDGVADVAFIHYQLPSPGLSGTLYILDASGREVNRLANNQLMGQEGMLQWNGTNSLGERVRSGYYIIVLSVFGADGFQQKWRKTIVVTSWL